MCVVANDHNGACVAPLFSVSCNFLGIFLDINIVIIYWLFYFKKMSDDSLRPEIQDLECSICFEDFDLNK